MRSLRLTTCASLLAVGLVLPGRGGADDEATAFEVFVLRGASVARVSGGADGALREEILREDPRPARREPAAQAVPERSPEIVVVVDAGGYPPGYALAAPLWWVPDLHRRRGIHRAVYRPGPPPPRFYHRGTRHPRGFPGGPKPR